MNREEKNAQAKQKIDDEILQNDVFDGRIQFGWKSNLG